MGSFFLPFVLLGAISLGSHRARALFAVTFAYIALHFVVLPNWQERWAGIFYLTMGVCVTMRMATAAQETSPQSDDLERAA